MRHYKIRSAKELQIIWTREQELFSVVIIIGHGSKKFLPFPIDGPISAENLDDLTRVWGAPKKTFISLCCNTGYQGFGGIFSKATICENFIAPFNVVHGAIASQFCQSFLAYHFLDGETVGIAFRHAREATPRGVSFRLWQGGCLKVGQE